MVKNECDRCKRGKSRIAFILQADPRLRYQNIIIDDDNKDKKGRMVPKFPAEVVSEFLPAKDYYPDIYAQRDLSDAGHPWMQDIIIEVDHKEQGNPSHRSDHSTRKDRLRDKHFRFMHRIPTIRFDLKDVIGRRAMTDEQILRQIEEEVEYQLE